MNIMTISKQGSGHYQTGINNQDFGFFVNGIGIVLDGCSACDNSEVGAKLFGQKLEEEIKIKGCNSLEKFEETAKKVFKKVSEPFEEKDDFIMKNMLFTIWAVSEQEDKFVVKYFGDGYIITQNNDNQVSYLAFSYGNAPPYLAYKHHTEYAEKFQKYDFKTLEFPKSDFKAIGICSDGVEPIAKGIVKIPDSFLFDGSKEAVINTIILQNRQKFYDDVTMCVFVN